MSILDRLTDGIVEARLRAEEASSRSRRRIAGQDDRGPWGTLLAAALGAIAGGVAVFLLDPARGTGRRARAMDQTAAAARRAWRGTERAGRMIGARVNGAVEAAKYAGTSAPMPNDAALAEKVESELFRDPELPKGSININAERGVVVLRGEVPDVKMRRAIERTVRKIDDVWDVQNLLHLPGEPAKPISG